MTSAISYSTVPPEINSGRMYAGPGPESMLAAAAAWNALSSELHSAAIEYEAVVSALTAGPWAGPSAVNTAAAVAPYLLWMRETAVQAATAGSQAGMAAAAYEAAFAAHVPPPVIEANRAQLQMLVATNVYGQNTAAISATEAQYSQMWAQDALAMDGYLSASAAATSRLQPFTAPPQTADAAAPVVQAAAVNEASSTAAGNTASSVAAATTASSIPSSGFPILDAATKIAEAYNQFWTNLLDSIVPFGSQWYLAAFESLGFLNAINLTVNNIFLLVNFPTSQWLAHTPPIPYASPSREMLRAGLGMAGSGVLHPIPVSTSAVSAVMGNAPVSAGMGNAGSVVGKLSVPPTWATSTTAIRTVAAALTASSEDAVPLAALGAGGLLSSMSIAGMLGSALGAGAPTAVGGASRRLTPIKDLKDKNSPEHLKRIVAQISDRPESVQHHTVEQDGLDDLLEQLAKKPGVHAVHLKKTKVVPPEAY